MRRRHSPRLTVFWEKQSRGRKKGRKTKNHKLFNHHKPRGRLSAKGKKKRHLKKARRWMAGQSGEADMLNLNMSLKATILIHVPKQEKGD